MFVFSVHVTQQFMTFISKTDLQSSYAFVESFRQECTETEITLF